MSDAERPAMPRFEAGEHIGKAAIVGLIAMLTVSAAVIAGLLVAGVGGHLRSEAGR